MDTLFAFVLDNLSRYYPLGNVTTVFEQDEDTKSWGGANSKLMGTRGSRSWRVQPVHASSFPATPSDRVLVVVCVDRCEDA